MEFRKYAQETVSRCALLVTAEEQHALHALAELGVGEPVNLEDEIAKAISERLAAFKEEVLAEVKALLPDPIKAEQAAVAETPAPAPEVKPQ